MFLYRSNPQYALWVASGTIAPKIGQTSPQYDEANRNLSNHEAGSRSHRKQLVAGMPQETTGSVKYENGLGRCARTQHDREKTIWRRDSCDGDRPGRRDPVHGQPEWL